MATPVYELRSLRAVGVFHPRDAYLERRLIWGTTPAPLAPVTYRLTAQVAGPAANQDVPIELATGRNWSGFDLFHGRVRTRDGNVRRVDLPSGTYRVRLTSSLYQVLDADLAMPQATAPHVLRLEPGPAYPFPRA